MSYARWGRKDSSVYVFYNCDDKFECHCCYLDTTEGEHYLTDTPWEMWQHLREHVEAGCRVPWGTFEQLEEEYYEEEFNDGTTRPRPFLEEGQDCSVETLCFLIDVAREEHEHAKGVFAWQSELVDELVEDELDAMGTTEDEVFGTHAERERSLEFEQLLLRQRLARLRMRLRHRAAADMEEPKEDLPPLVRAYTVGRLRDRVLMRMLASVKPFDKETIDEPQD